MACFQSEGIEPSAKVMFIRTVRGFAMTPKLSLRRRAGTSARPVDLHDLIRFNSLLANSSLILDNLNAWCVLDKNLGLGIGRNKPLILLFDFTFIQ